MTYRKLMTPAEFAARPFARALAGTVLLLGCCTLCAQSKGKPAPYLDRTLPVEQRVDALVGRMTLEEKVSQMQNDASAIPRLGIPAYNWWNEGLHGVARAGYATLFPQAIGLAATWDTDLMQRVGDTISTEARAKYNQAQREDNRSIFYGLTFWSPNINIDRDPRWGRGQETYGEDPFLTGEIGAAFVRGMQGGDPRYLKVAATAKHFAVHSGPESLRHSFDAKISAYDLADTYMPAFHKLVAEAHAASVMCAYNAVDGAPACASKMLLGKTLRDQWRFNGSIVSDCAAIADIAMGHKFAADVTAASAAAVNAGTDLSCGKEFATLVEAVHRGLISEGAIDAAVKRLFVTRFRLGMFDPPADVPYSGIGMEQNDSPAHAEIALKAARESLVLLKNDRQMLPLQSAIHAVAVVGPNASTLASLEGNYNGAASHPVTPLAALEERMPGRVRYAQGSAYVDGAMLPVPQTYLTTAADKAREPGLRAEYFNGSGFTGNAVARRVDRQIDFDWNGAAPMAGVTPANFSVRWTGFIVPPAPGAISFGFSMAHCSTCDDSEAIRVWLDGEQVYSFDHAATRGRRAPTPPFQLNFADTRPHAVRIEYQHRAPHFGAGLMFKWTPPAEVLLKAAVEAAKQSEVTVAFLGLSPELEGEEMPIRIEGFDGGDRTSIELPQAQRKLVAALAATGKPLLVVLMNGGAIALGDSGAKAAAILEAWYPGELGGKAIAEALFGEVNPSGRLPVTFYASTSQLPPFEDYSMANRTYRYFNGKPEFGFGYGMSYTTFEYSAGQLSTAKLDAGNPLQLHVNLRNTGMRDGEETVEVYLVPKANKSAPRLSLVAFRKVQLNKGASTPVEIDIKPEELSLVTQTGSRIIQAGDYELFVGGGQPGAAKGIFLPLQIVGSMPVAP